MKALLILVVALALAGCNDICDKECKQHGYARGSTCDRGLGCDCWCWKGIRIDDPRPEAPLKGGEG